MSLLDARTAAPPAAPAAPSQPIPAALADVRPSIVPTDPAFVLVYGRSGIGKTVACGWAAPTGLALAAPNALTSVLTTCGYGLAYAPVGSIGDVLAVMQDLATKREAAEKAKKPWVPPFDAILVDDLSFLAEQTLAHLENVRKLSGFKLWDALRDDILSFRDLARFAGVHVIVNAWEQVPQVKADGTRVLGGPMLSGKLPEKMPAMCDLVLRMRYEPARKPWPAVFECHPDGAYVMKDRFTVVPDVCPPNLGEILRFAGYKLARHPSLPWQEDAVEQIAQQFWPLEVPARSAEANRLVGDLIAKGVSPSAARMTLVDAIDRVTLRQLYALRFTNVF